MSDTRYESSLVSWLISKLGPVLLGLLIMGFISRPSEDEWLFVFFFLFLFASLSYAFFVAQVRFTERGVRYRRFLAWKEASWDQFESIERPSGYPVDVLVLKFREARFPLNQIWFYPAGRQKMYRPELTDALTFAAEAIRKARPNEAPAPTEKSLQVSRSVGVFQIILLFACLAVGLVLRVRTVYLETKSSEPGSIIVRIGDLVFHPGIFFISFLAASVLYALVKKWSCAWREGRSKTIVLCLAIAPATILFSIAVLWVLS